jgi:alpha-L-rhamnosidase
LSVEIKISNLRTEYKVDPLGIGSLIPRLSWELKSPHRGILQSAYRIKCANTAADLKNNINILWDTQKVESGQSVHLEYRGTALKSGERIYWQAKVWDNKGNESDWSKPAWWEMGLLERSDWIARWIEPGIQENIADSAPCPHVRYEFLSKENIRSARVYITCHGLYKLSINGTKIGDEVFTPGWTSYHKRLQYQVFDVTEQVKPGHNAIGVILGDGWYRGFLGWQGKRNFYGDKLALLFQLKIIYEDGATDIISSNKNWKAAKGAILKSDIYNGETYDARKELKGWDMPGFDDTNWAKSLERDDSCFV